MRLPEGAQVMANRRFKQSFLSAAIAFSLLVIAQAFAADPATSVPGNGEIGSLGSNFAQDTNSVALPTYNQGLSFGDPFAACKNQVDQKQNQPDPNLFKIFLLNCKTSSAPDDAVSKNLSLDEPTATPAKPNAVGKCGSTKGPEAAKGGCEDYKKGDTYDYTKIITDQQLACSAEQGIICRDNQLDTVDTQLKCLKDNAGQLTTQIGALKDMYGKNYDKATKAIAQIDGIKADRDYQAKDVDSRLNGGEAAHGGTGLRDLAKATSAALANVNGQVLTMDTTLRKNAKLRPILETRKQNLVRQATARVTSACFNNVATAGGYYYCAKPENGGVPVSFKDYVVCRYQQEKMHIGKKIETDAYTKAKADSAASELNQALTNIFGNSKYFSQQNPRSAIISDFNRFNINGYDFAGQIAKRIFGDPNNGKPPNDEKPPCYDQAKALVIDESKNPSAVSAGSGTPPSGTPAASGDALAVSDGDRAQFADIFNQEQQLLDSEQTMAANATSMLNANNELFQKDIEGLSGKHASFPLDQWKCNGQDPRRQLQCLKYVQTTLNNLLLGGTADSNLILDMTAPHNPQNHITFQCKGLNGCVTAMTNLSKSLDIERQRLDKFKIDYISNVNSSTEGFNRNVAASFNGVSKSLSDQLDAINRTMENLGYDKFTKSAIKLTKMEKNDKGIYSVPDDILGVVGGLIVPPMLDVNGDFQNSTGFKEARKNLETDKSAADAALQKFGAIPQGLLAICKSTELKAKVGAAKADIETFTSLNCASAPICAKVGGNTLFELGKSIGALQLPGSGDTFGVSLIDLQSDLVGLSGAVCQSIQCEYPQVCPTISLPTQCDSSFRKIKQEETFLRSYIPGSSRAIPLH